MAVRGTSQTAELTAMLMALRRAKARGKAAPPEYIKTDSVYAMKTARGEWKTKKGTNEAIAREVRKAYIQVRETRGAGAVTITHVRAHRGTLGNEIADRLADRGKTTSGVATEWARRKMREMQQEERSNTHHHTTTTTINNTLQHTTIQPLDTG